MGVWVFIHTGSLVTLSAIHNFRTKDAGEEGKLVFPPFCFTSASAGTGSWTCILPKAQTQALLAVGSTVHQLGDEVKVCLHCWFWNLQHARSTGRPQELTFTPHTSLNANPSYQPSVSCQDGRARSQHPALPPKQARLL